MGQLPAGEVTTPVPFNAPPPAATDIQVLIVDARPISRQILTHSVMMMPGFQVAECCPSVHEALLTLRRRPAHLVLLRPSANTSALTFLPRARRSRFNGAVVVLASRLSIPQGAAFVQQGVSAICPANLSSAELMEVMQLAIEGVTRVEERYFRAAARLTPPHATPEFSDRERQVIYYLMAGLRNKEIAARIHLSEAVVKATLQQIYNVAGVHSRGRLVCMLSDGGLLRSELPRPFIPAHKTSAW